VVASDFLIFIYDTLSVYTALLAGTSNTVVLVTVLEKCCFVNCDVHFPFPYRIIISELKGSFW